MDIREADFSDALHPRFPKGSPRGGQFAPKLGAAARAFGKRGTAAALAKYYSGTRRGAVQITPAVTLPSLRRSLQIAPRPSIESLRATAIALNASRGGPFQPRAPRRVPVPGVGALKSAASALAAGASEFGKTVVDAADSTQFRTARVAGRSGLRTKEVVHDRSVLRRGVRTARKVAGTSLGRKVLGTALLAGGVMSAREALPGARSQRDHARLITYGRNQRIAWQKHQRIKTKSGQEVEPGQGVRVGHSRVPAIYLGAEWRPQGRINTTTGRLVVETRKGRRVVPYTAIKSRRRDVAMSPAEAMAHASQFSLGKRTWQRRPPTGAQAMRAALAKRHSKRVRFELRNELRNLRRHGTLGDRVAARAIDRASAQYFARTLNRQRTRHRRPNARANNALRAGR